MTRMKFCICKCFYTSNIFIQRYKVHVSYDWDKETFVKTYKEILQNHGCTDVEEVIPEIETELKRRQNLENESYERKCLAATLYKRLHPEIFQLKDSFLTSEFKDLIKMCKQGIEKAKVLQTITAVTKNLYSFPVFTPEFCRMFLEEVNNIEASDVPKGRPNTMNNYGILLGEFGFDENFFNVLREEYLSPISRVLFPEWCGEKLDSHKVFVVKYKVGEDRDLDYHFDNAEV